MRNKWQGAAGKTDLMSRTGGINTVIISILCLRRLPAFVSASKIRIDVDGTSRDLPVLCKVL